MTEERAIRTSVEADVVGDSTVSRALQALDPARLDPTYWFRLHQRIVMGARSELDRRRMLAGVTVEEVVVSWGRAVVPGALLAAAVAALLLLRTPVAPVAMLSVEDLLAQASGSDPIPAALMSLPELEPDGIMFASSNGF
jgi:hypothetical protein